jgi:hypothetical protein
MFWIKIRECRILFEIVDMHQEVTVSRAFRACGFSVVVCVLLTSQAIYAQDVTTTASAPTADNQDFSWLRFGLHGTQFTQDSGSSGSMMLAWSPEYRLGSDFSAKADIGGTVIHRTDDSKINVISATLAAQYAFSANYAANVGYTAQDWSDETPSPAGPTAGMSYHFTEQVLPFVDALRVQYAALKADEIKISQISVGMETSL